jgi:hypothetical protein
MKTKANLQLALLIECDMEIILFATAPSLYTIGVGGCFFGSRQPGPEADHSPPTIVEVKNGGAISPFSHTSSGRNV